jgi:predicted O-methyltransferase YrrM
MNRKPIKGMLFGVGIFMVGVATLLTALAQKTPTAENLDAKVEKFLKGKRANWQDWNVPYQDGQELYNLILKNNYTRALEIGTSTGHSAIWMAWALSKTGGRLITIEIDAGRYKTALENFKQAGMERFIDARLADAHQLVRQLEGPFDFIFSDADKEWYLQYFKDLDGKLVKGGCFTAHNVNHPFGGIKEFLDFIQGLPNYQTTIQRSGGAGISISYKK